MKQIRDISEDEVNKLVSGIGFGLIANKIKKVRLEKGDTEANELKAIWDEYFGADGIHFFNGVEGFEMPWLIEKYRNEM